MSSGLNRDCMYRQLSEVFPFTSFNFLLRKAHQRRRRGEYKSARKEESRVYIGTVSLGSCLWMDRTDVPHTHNNNKRRIRIEENRIFIATSNFLFSSRSPDVLCLRVPRWTANGSVSALRPASGAVPEPERRDTAGVSTHKVESLGRRRVVEGPRDLDVAAMVSRRMLTRETLILHRSRLINTIKLYRYFLFNGCNQMLWERKSWFIVITFFSAQRIRFHSLNHLRKPIYNPSQKIADYPQKHITGHAMSYLCVINHIKCRHQSTIE